jgi:chaperonin GroES
LKLKNRLNPGFICPILMLRSPSRGPSWLWVPIGLTEHGATIKAPVKAGDSVIYKKWGGNDVKIGDIEYQFLKFEDILAIVK